MVADPRIQAELDKNIDHRVSVANEIHKRVPNAF
jgi:hypothetical protein